MGAPSMLEEAFLLWVWMAFLLSSVMLVGGLVALADWCVRAYHRHRIAQLRRQYRCAIPNRALPRFPARLF